MKASKIVLAVVFSASTAMMAQMTVAPEQVGQRPEQFGQRTVQRYAMVLDLSSTQQQQALVIFTNEETAEIPIRAAEHSGREVLQSAIKSNDAAMIRQTCELLGQLAGQNNLARSLADAQFYALLTPEQQTRYDQLPPRAQSSGLERTGPSRMAIPS